MTLTQMLSRLLGRRQPPTVPPIIIGATGGSGTRAVHGLLSDAGLFMGQRLNGAGDAMDFEPFLDDHINSLLQTTRTLDYQPSDLPDALWQKVMEDFQAAAATYLQEHTGGPWGWKNPRTMYVLPVIHAIFPEFSFIHLVRDGRDMALSQNQNQPRKHYAALFGRPLPEEAPDVAAIELWDKANRTAAAWGERTLGPRYVRIQFENLCADPVGSVRLLKERLGLPVDNLTNLAARVRTPDSLGRWREQDPDTIARLSVAGAEGLRTFGYLR